MRRVGDLDLGVCNCLPIAGQVLVQGSILPGRGQKAEVITVLLRYFRPHVLQLACIFIAEGKEGRGKQQPQRGVDRLLVLRLSYAMILLPGVEKQNHEDQKEGHWKSTLLNTVCMEWQLLLFFYRLSESGSWDFSQPSWKCQRLANHF